MTGSRFPRGFQHRPADQDTCPKIGAAIAAAPRPVRTAQPVAGLPTLPNDVSLGQIAATAHGFIAIGGSQSSSGNTTVVLTSPDGLSWTEKPAGALAGWQVGFLEPTPSGVAAVGGTESGQVALFTSTDLSSWARHSVPAGFAPTAVLSLNDGTLVVGGVQNHRPAIWRSTDNGATWTASTGMTGTGEDSAISQLLAATGHLLAWGTVGHNDDASSGTPARPQLWISSDNGAHKVPGRVREIL